jgi:hypothetical protein
MPAWNPNWNPVEIDEVGLLDAIADCAAAIAMIEEGQASVAPFVSRARDGWEGPARLDFDDDYASIERHAEGVIAELRQASLGFQREIAEAHEEQARRWADQDRWRREKADEDLRAEQLREQAAREQAAREQATRTPAVAR